MFSVNRSKNKKLNALNNKLPNIVHIDSYMEKFKLKKGNNSLSKQAIDLNKINNNNKNNIYLINSRNYKNKIEKKAIILLI